MRYIKKLISTLASMSYYSGGNDLLDDHSSATYLQYVSEESLTTPQQNNAVSYTHLTLPTTTSV